MLGDEKEREGGIWVKEGGDWVTERGGAVVGGEKERGGNWVSERGGLGNGEGRLLWGSGCTVVKGVGQLGFGGLP